MNVFYALPNQSQMSLFRPASPERGAAPNASKTTYVPFIALSLLTNLLECYADSMIDLLLS